MMALNAEQFLKGKASRGDQARMALLIAGIEIFGESSLESATTRQIAARAKQNVAAISYYFGSKEGLYRAGVEFIVEMMQQTIGSEVGRIEDEIKSVSPSPQKCIEYLQALFGALSERALLREEAVYVSRIMMREMARPTEAFEIIWGGPLKRFHDLVIRLISTCLNLGRRDEYAVVLAHSLFGQLLGFRVGRELVLRQAGWTDYGERERSIINAVVKENIGALLKGLRSRRRHSKTQK